MIVFRAKLCRICDKFGAHVSPQFLTYLGETAFLAILAVDGQLNI